MIKPKARGTGWFATLLGALLIVALLASAAISAGYLSRRSADQLRWVQHSYEVVETLMKTQIVLFQAVGAHNALLLGLTTSAQTWQDFGHDATILEADADYLRAMTTDNPEQAARAAVIDQRIDTLVAQMRSSTLAPGTGAEAFDTIKATLRERSAVNAQINAMTAAERRLLDKRTHAYAEIAAAINTFLTAALAAAGLFAIIALWSLRRSLQQGREKILDLQASRAKLAASNEEINTTRHRLQSILDHATDAILLIGPDGSVRLANKASSLLFGLPNDAILGHAASERIVGLAAGTTEVFGIRGDGSRFPGDMSVGGGAGERADETVCILRDATERHRLSQLKNEFVSTVSHELRTPLTSIRGSLGLVMSGAAGELPPKARQFVEIAHNNSARLVHLVNDILDIEKIESGRLDFRHETLDAAGIVQQAIEANRAYGEPFGVTFAAELDVPPQTAVMADAGRVQQVMANLLSNAAKFSPPGGTVDIGVTASPDHIRITVRDRGAGIPAEFRDRIFQRFAQADASDRRQKGGTGLGLSISKAIVEQHGGAMGFTAPEDGGTCFWFTLPRLQQTAPVADEPASPVQKRRILVVEDDVDVAHLLAFMLNTQGWHVETAQTARQAEMLLAQQQFDVMTLDILLPDEDGIALFKRLRANAATHDLPVVIVSAATDKARLQLNGDALSVIDWLDKPIDQNRLRNAVYRALGTAERQRPPSPVVLHVEDDPDIFHVVEAVIGSSAEVVRAPLLADARRELDARSFSLVILDVTLPDGSGLDLIETIRGLPNPPPIMIFSASDSDAVVAARVTATLLKTRTDNLALQEIISGLITRGPVQQPEPFDTKTDV
jgi:signal transduction histidine kinase/DNA-binding response OmpR family regulator